MFAASVMACHDLILVDSPCPDLLVNISLFSKTWPVGELYGFVVARG